MIVASALEYCHELDRELRQLGLRKEERRLADAGCSSVQALDELDVSATDGPAEADQQS